ncbi:unnamed protein product [Peniophora sp. CBMAI 1063]|nr:unnamed protein product [Peniophora sp. CBMAI 1063]
MHLLQRAVRCQHRACACGPIASTSRQASSYQKQRPRSRLDTSLEAQGNASRAPFERESVPHEGRYAAGERPTHINLQERLARRRQRLDRRADRDAQRSERLDLPPRARDVRDDQEPEREREKEQFMMDDVASAFDYATPATPMQGLPQTFSSPPLTPGLRSSVHDFLGHEAHPTPIQRLALANLVGRETPTHAMIAAETGSGKSLAYLLPMLQELKRTEPSARQGHGPRGIVLSPTHELARQLAFFGKQLVHHDKLRVQTASRANVKSNATASKMSETFSDAQSGEGEFSVAPGGAGAHGVDVLVGTTRKLLEMARGRGWHKADEDLFEKKRPRKPAQPEISLKDVEWVVVDEADVLYNKDFIEETEALLSDIAHARGSPVPAEGLAAYPFNLILSSATIPVALNTHLATRLPNLQRLVSPSVHRLPSKLAVEFSAYTSGNRHADVERKIRELWADDAHMGRDRSRIVVFANGRGTVEMLGKYLSDKGVPNVAVTGGADVRSFGSNRHLKGFLSSQPAPATPAAEELPEGIPKPVDNDKSPRVLVSTALLARGMDFAPDVRTVFLLDAPATAADFLHRAGRTARAGRPGRLVIFERAKGRGSEYGKVVRRSLAALGRTRQSVKQ